MMTNTNMMFGFIEIECKRWNDNSEFGLQLVPVNFIKYIEEDTNGKVQYWNHDLIRYQTKLSILEFSDLLRDAGYNVGVSR